MPVQSHIGFSRHILPAFYLLLCGWGFWFSAHDGLSRWRSGSAVPQNNITYAEEAVSLTPSDPDAYYARAKIFGAAGDVGKEIEDLRRSAELRANDYYLWLELGYAQSKTDDLQGALSSFRRSVALAPFYGQPRWYLGHTMLRISQFEEGFKELRKAAASSPDLYPELLDLAPEVYGN